MSYLGPIRKKLGTDLLLVPSVAGVIRNESNALLLVRKSEDGIWGLPAGAIEPGEGPTQAVIREVLEETGLEVVPTKIIGVFGGKHFRFTYPNGDMVEYLVTLLECVIKGTPKQGVDEEICKICLLYTSPSPRD